MSWDGKNGFTIGNASQATPGEGPEQAHAAAQPTWTSNAPNRSQMLTASAVEFPNDQTQQGAAAIQPNTSSYLLAGSTLPYPVFARWW